MSSLPAVPTVPSIQSLQIGNVWFEERQGGLARVFFELFRHLPECGIGFRGLVIGSGGIEKKYGDSLREFASAGQAMPVRLLKARSAVWDALKTGKIDVVASHFALYTFPALHHIKNVPLVVHFHGPWAAEAQVEGFSRLRCRLQGALEHSVYRRASRFIVLSKAFARELIERYRVPEDRVRIVPGGVDTARFHCEISRTEARHRLGWPADRFIVLAVRRLAHRMGLEDLILATKSLVPKHSDILVQVAGAGEMARQLECQIEMLGLSNYVKLLGRVDEERLPLAYRAADISVVPTVSLEGFGMITLESLASGIPVMVTPVGGLPEVVSNLSPNLIFDGSGPDAIARGISQVLRGERVLPDTEECRRHAETYYTWPSVARRTRQVYLEALG